MGFGDSVLNLVQSAGGYTRKAIITIEDRREKKTEIKVGGETFTFNEESSFTPVMSAGSQNPNRYFEVKFNPNQITFKSSNPSAKYKTNYSAKDDEKEKEKSKKEDSHKTIEMSVTLLFDDYERTDAFRLEKINDAGSTARSFVDSIATKGKKHSVRQQVEGFIAAMRKSKTRGISFAWGEMCYEGTLSSVSAEYTMFSPSGEPIRAEVELKMICLNTVQNNDEMGSWQESFDNLIGKDIVKNVVTDKGGKLKNVTYENGVTDLHSKNIANSILNLKL